MSLLQEAILQLILVLEAENAALRRMDIPASNAQLGAKHAALARFEAAMSIKPRPTAGDGTLMQISTRLSETANDNKHLLERAMVAQRHMMALMAKAINAANASSRYGCRGIMLGSQPGGAFGLRSSA